MPLFILNNQELSTVPSTSFAAEKILERQDLQAALRDNIKIIAPDTLIISEEFSDWSESKRRIDLLGIDKDANIVVIELKRDSTGCHMELQALRYAAMVSTLTFTKAVKIFQEYLNKSGTNKDAEAELLDFLEWENPSDEIFPTETRVILSAANFSKELTTAVMWMNERGLDIRCVRMQPYKLEGSELLIDIQQVIPLPEAAEYQIRVREQAVEHKAAAQNKKDNTKYEFLGNTYGKGRLVHAVVNQYFRENPNSTIEDLRAKFPDSLQSHYGVVTSRSEAERILKETGYKRHYLNENDLLKLNDGNEIAICKEWGIGNISPFLEMARRLYEISEVKPICS